MEVIDQALLKKFVKLAGERLKGRWVLLGGTLLPLLGIEYRATSDIDLAGLGNAERGQILQLMDLATELGLPVESINQAAAYFLMKHEPFEDHLILLHHGKNADIFRPDLYLFLAMKLGRFSPTDASDCLALIRLEKPSARSELKKIQKLVMDKLKKADSEEAKVALEKLIAALA
jgi:hypothetical protein